MSRKFKGKKNKTRENQSKNKRKQGKKENIIARKFKGKL